jgi:heavy metal efflux system protein
MNGIMVVDCFNRLIEGGMEREDALRGTCDLQMWSMLMTCVAACVGLLPLDRRTAGRHLHRMLLVIG